MTEHKTTVAAANMEPTSTDNTPIRRSLEEKMMNLSRQCITCDGPGCDVIAPNNTCTRCCVAYYCSRTCQKSHWKQHKQMCHNQQERRTYLQTLESSSLLSLLGPDGTTNNNNDNCGICLEPHDDRRVIVPGCQHGFCYRCLIDWRETDWNNDVAKHDQSTCCPLCRATIMQGVEDDVVKKARYYAARAVAAVAVAAVDNKNSNGNHQQHQETITQKDHFVALALFELDKLMGAKDLETKVLPLLAKAEILRQVGEPTTAIMTILQQVQQIFTDGERNTALLMSSMSSINATPIELERATKRLETLAADGAMLLTGRPDETRKIFDMKLQLAECQGDSGNWNEAKTMIGELLASGGSLDNNHHSEWRTQEQGMKLRCEYLRCAMAAGDIDIDTVIKLGNDRIQRDRRMPGYYKYVALAYKRKGDIQAAKDTANRGLLYLVVDETRPWDDETTKAELFDLYEEL